MQIQRPRIQLYDNVIINLTLTSHIPLLQHRHDTTPSGDAPKNGYSLLMYNPHL